MTKVFFIDRRGRVRGRVRAGERVAPTNTIAKPPQYLVNQPRARTSSTQSSGFHKRVSFRPIAPALRGAPGTDCQGVSVDPPRCAREGWRARRACWRAATRRRRRRAGWASPRLFAWIPPRRTRRGAWTRRGTPRGGRSPRAGAWRASPISTCARLKNGWCPRTARKVRRKPSPEAHRHRANRTLRPAPSSASLPIATPGFREERASAPPRAPFADREPVPPTLKKLSMRNHRQPLPRSRACSTATCPTSASSAT